MHRVFSPDCLCNLSILLRSFQILLGLMILATVFSVSHKGTILSYCVRLTAGLFSVVLYTPLVLPHLIVHFSPVLVLGGELVSWLLWKSSLIHFSWNLVCHQVHPHDFKFTIVSAGCSFVGLALSTTALVLLACGSLRHASQKKQWKCRDFFRCGGILQKSVAKTCPSYCCEKQPMDEEWTADGKNVVIALEEECTASLDNVFAISSERNSFERVSIELSRFNIKRPSSRAESLESIVSSDSSFSQDSYVCECSDCRSTSSFSLDSPSEISTMKGDNSEIQGIPFADGDHDDGGGAGWRRCSSGGNGGNSPRVYGE